IRGGGAVTTGGPSEKWLRINQLMREKRIAVLMIQEAHLVENEAEELNRLFDSSLKVFTMPDPVTPTAARGVAFVLNKTLVNTAEARVVTLIPGRAAALSLGWATGKTLTLLNVYAPNATRKNASFWTTLRDEVGNRRMNKVDVIAGDFNVVLDSLDRLPARSDQETATEGLRSLLASLSMVDGWREENHGVRGYSFLQTATASQSRIDRIYISRHHNARAGGWEIMDSGIKTDHKLVLTSVANTAAPYIGNGRWTMPKSLLTDAYFLAKIINRGCDLNNEIERRCREGTYVNIQRMYQDFKQEVRAIARDRAKRLSAKWDRDMKGLDEQIKSVLS
ncbi:Endonuclease/exonuclease/phosphatase, partial [Lenzites betulinus]